MTDSRARARIDRPVIRQRLDTYSKSELLIMGSELKRCIDALNSQAQDSRLLRRYRSRARSTARAASRDLYRIGKELVKRETEQTAQLLGDEWPEPA